MENILREMIREGSLLFRSPILVPRIAQAAHAHGAKIEWARGEVDRVWCDIPAATKTYITCGRAWVNRLHYVAGNFKDAVEIIAAYREEVRNYEKDSTVLPTWFQDYAVLGEQKRCRSIVQQECVGNWTSRTKDIIGWGTDRWVSCIKFMRTMNNDRPNSSLYEDKRVRKLI